LAIRVLSNQGPTNSNTCANTFLSHTRNAAFSHFSRPVTSNISSTICSRAIKTLALPNLQTYHEMAFVIRCRFISINSPFFQFGLVAVYARFPFTSSSFISDYDIYEEIKKYIALQQGRQGTFQSHLPHLSLSRVPPIARHCLTWHLPSTYAKFPTRHPWSSIGSIPCCHISAENNQFDLFPVYKRHLIYFLLVSRSHVAQSFSGYPG
jgi:hypothetical protein